MGKKRKRKRRGKGPAPGSAKTSVDFWGAASKLPKVEKVTVTSDVYAVARSLGRPPFSGHEAVSEYYLRAVYENTVKLAEVLSVAGELQADADNNTTD